MTSHTAVPAAAKGEVRLTPEELRDVSTKVKLRHIHGKGLGLVARRDLPAHTKVGVYGGKVYDAAGFERLTGQGHTSGVYAVDYFVKNSATGRVKDGLMLDPEMGKQLKGHGNVLAAFINEPSAGKQPNTIWVRNYETEKLELWTTKAIRSGEELTACYGDTYNRNYATSCTRKPGVLHYIKRGMKHPRQL